MNIKINSLRFSPTKDLETFVEGKVRKLGLFYDEIIGAEVFLKLENAQNTENKVAESKSFEESTDNAIEAIKRQIKRYKKKRKRA